MFHQNVGNFLFPCDETPIITQLLRRVTIQRLLVFLSPSYTYVPIVFVIVLFIFLLFFGNVSQLLVLHVSHNRHWRGRLTPQVSTHTLVMAGRRRAGVPRQLSKATMEFEDFEQRIRHSSSSPSSVTRARQLRARQITATGAQKVCHVDRSHVSLATQNPVPGLMEVLRGILTVKCTPYLRLLLRNTTKA